MAEDFLPLNGTDHVELYVGNAKQSAYYYQMAWGYELIAYAGPETVFVTEHRMYYSKVKSDWC